MTQEHLMLGTRSVRRIGYGAMRLPDDPSAAEALLHHALDLGVDHFDTARYYGAANERLASALRETVRDDVLVATKVGWANDGTSPRPAPQPEDLAASIHENLRSLGVERLGLVNLRRGAAPGIPRVDVPIAEQLGALANLRDQGLIESIGLSAVSREELDEALALMPIACVQNMFSVFVRRDVDVVHRCAEVGIAFVPFFPLGGGRMSEVEALVSVAARHRASIAQVALAWLLALGPHVLLIPGTSMAAHLEDNLRATDIRLSEEDRALLDTAV